MKNLARGTLPRAEKGPVKPPPVIDGPLQAIVDAVSSWPGIDTTIHWHLFDKSRVDGVDFYFGEEELGHLHLDGSIHLATSASLGESLISEGAAKPFRYQQGWVEEQVRRIGPGAAVALFRRNYEHLQAQSSDTKNIRSDDH
jgi:Family of unknown function (DUF5519)